MTIPKVTRKKPPNAPDSAFWQAANHIDKCAATRDFTGDLTPFGFASTRDPAHLDTIHKAMIAAQTITPDLGVIATRTAAEKETAIAAEMAFFTDEPACIFWRHPDALTFAVTVPYRFSRPYGDAQAFVFTHAPAPSAQDQSKRIATLAALDAANQTRRANPHAAEIDAYQARKSANGTTFAFAKYLSYTGRDQSIQTASGFCAAKTGDAPALYLNVGLSELCQ